MIQINITTCCKDTFWFPWLQQLLLANSFIQKHIWSQKNIATPPTSSILLETTTTQIQELDSHNDKGVEGNFAFVMAYMDSNLSGKWYRPYSTEMDDFAFSKHTTGIGWK